MNKFSQYQNMLTWLFQNLHQFGLDDCQLFKVKKVDTFNTEHNSVEYRILMVDYFGDPYCVWVLEVFKYSGIYQTLHN